MKTNKLLINLAFLAITIFAFNACQEEEPEPDPKPTYGEFSLKMEHLWGMSLDPFVLNQPLYHPMTKDTLTFTTFKYYVSNIQLQKADGSWWKEDESYHLVDLNQGIESMVKISNVPAGTYKSLKYMIGVDSTRNVSGAQQGALSVTNGMFWSWNTGYIMIKAEGTSPQSSTGDFAFHLGGFSGENNIIAEKSTDFNGETLDISTNASPMVHINVNPARLWHNGSSVSDRSKIHMPGAMAKTMADNFTSWINFDHIHR